MCVCVCVYMQNFHAPYYEFLPQKSDICQALLMICAGKLINTVQFSQTSDPPTI